MDKSLIGACGIYCRACDHYFANTEDGKHLMNNEKIAQRVKTHPCKGCKAENKKEICVYCVNCDVRLCSIEKNVELCTQCSSYPCEKLDRFTTGLEHHKEAAKSLCEHKNATTEKWHEFLEKRWSCPQCGKKYSYYETRCNSCNKEIEGLSPDVR